MSYYIVDLSQKIEQGMEHLPNQQKTFIFNNFTHEASKKETDSKSLGFAERSLIISESAGTHSDAIWKYKPSGAAIDELDLNYFIGRAVCLDVSHIRYPHYIEVNDLKAALETGQLEISEGTIVLLHTGHWNRTNGTVEYTKEYTGLSYEAAEWLAQEGAVNIGIDAPTIDLTPDDLNFSGHLACSNYNMTNTENLINLDRVVNQTFLYVGLPLKIKKGTGSPIRAIALLES